MSMTIDQIAFELLSLPAKSRAILAEKLITSLDEEVISDTESLWIEHAERRFAEIKNGTAKCKSAEDALREARTNLK